MNLTEFLLARIAEDEEWARNASRVRETRTGDSWTVGRGRYGLNKLTRPGGEVGEVLVEAAPHIARHDPARILAECEAKRRIVELHKSWPVLVEGPPEFDQPGSDVGAMTMRLSKQLAWLTEQEYRKRFGSEPPTGPVLAALALPYADHPDYDPSWRP